MGPWGSGKTSLLNLIQEEMGRDDGIYLSFNPWMFSGSDQLVERFFDELASQLKLKSRQFDGLAERLEAYGDVVAPLQVIPVVGGWLGRVAGGAKALKELREARRGGVHETRDAVRSALRELATPIVVAIDDIDRLQTSEIRDIFRLIRLTATFPNIIYLVAFDRQRVEDALTEDRLQGREYLEKIVQVVYDLPDVPQAILHQELLNALIASIFDRGIEGYSTPERWPDILQEVIVPLVTNMRRVRRYAGSVRVTVMSLAKHVDLNDLLALEAVRIFLPDVFYEILRNQGALTATGRSFLDSDWEERQRVKLQRIVSLAEEQQHVVERLFARVFPHASQLLNDHSADIEDWGRYARDRRVAHPDVLASYADHFGEVRLRPLRDAERAFELLSSQEKLEEFFRSVDKSEWEVAISNLEHYEDDFRPEMVVPATVVLVNLIEEIPSTARGVLSLSPRQVVSRIVYRLFKTSASSGSVEVAARAVWPDLKSLTSKLYFLHMVKYEKDGEYVLLTQEQSARLEREFRDEVRASGADVLAREEEGYWLVRWVKESAAPDEPMSDVLEDDRLAPVLVKGSVGIERRQSFTTRLDEVAKWFDFPSLASLVGGEAEAHRLVDLCREETHDQQLMEAVDLADRYTSGEITGPAWRPR
jgi:hypothetical protein